MPRRSLLGEANARVPFHKAALWAKVGSGIEKERGEKAWCPKTCSGHKSMRIFPDHGWCYSCHTWFTVVTLLALTEQLSYEDAAKFALDKIGYVPPSYAELWAATLRPPEVNREDLGAALKLWCSGQDPAWSTHQYLQPVSNMLSKCLALLPRVRSESDCDRWLEASKLAMYRVLSQVKQPAVDGMT